MHSFIEVHIQQIHELSIYISYLRNIPDRGYFHCSRSGNCRDIRPKIDSEEDHYILSSCPIPLDFYEWSSGNTQTLNEGCSVVIPRASKLQGQIHPRRFNSCSFAPGTGIITLTSLPAPWKVWKFRNFQRVAPVFEICENEFLIIEFEAWTFWTDIEQNLNVITPICSVERFLQCFGKLALIFRAY